MLHTIVARKAHRVGRVLVPLGLAFLVAVLTAAGLFQTSSREITLASHDAVVRPSLEADLRGDVVLRTGPVLPDVRVPASGPVGVEVELGKTEAVSTGELIQRYAFIASRPRPQREVLVGAVRDMAVSAGLRGLAAGVTVIGLWLLVGPRRRREVLAAADHPRAVVVVVGVALVAVAVWQPWVEPPPPDEPEEWQPLAEFLGPGIPLPAEAAELEVGTGSVVSTGTRRLLRSAVDTYDRSRAFYAAATEAAGDLELREPQDGETVAILVADRHDNVGMDRVAAKVAEVAGATAVLDAGDDTSTGARWEAFSLDSMDEAFGDLERWAVNGNHDHGSFVGERLEQLGWTVLDGEVVEGPGRSTILGAPDPRASGLGTWRDEAGLSFAEHADRLADAACAADEEGERVSTLVVHDTNSGRPALERGCVDLLVGGHLHVTVGPTKVVAENGRTGWSYINGTTGGAAYAIAVGSKLRRSADIGLITYRGGRPVGIQGVTLQTNGVFAVDAWTPLTYPEDEARAEQGPRVRDGRERRRQPVPEADRERARAGRR